MRVKIYQINPERDENKVKFMGSRLMEKRGLSDQPEPSIYDEVFDADIEETDPEDIYIRFNTTMHPLFRGHSLSISDVLATEDGTFFCDRMGFRKVDFDESQTQKPDDMMKIVFVEPGRKPYEAEIPHTLEDEQKAVGGYIEPVYNEDGTTCLIGNEEAKLMGLPGNRRIGDGSSIIAGSFFVVGLTEDDFRSLTEEESARYMEKFAEPEEISQEEVNNDMGFRIFMG